MADSMDFEATAVPRALEDALSLTAGTTYTVWNTDTTGTVRFRTAALAPVNTANALRLSPGGGVEVAVTADSKTWAWTDDPDGASLLVETNP